MSLDVADDERRAASLFVRSYNGSSARVSVKLESNNEVICLVVGSHDVPWLRALATGLKRSRYHGRAVALKYAMSPEIYILASLSLLGRK